MTKDQIRLLMRKANKNVAPEGRNRAAEIIFRAIEESTQFVNSQRIALYAALPDEIPTRSVIERWCALGKEIFLPRITGETSMEFYPYRPDKIEVGAFGIDEPQGDDAIEPSQIELMILPGVAFTAEGERLGRGRGYYDRYLSREGYAAYNIGVCYKHQLCEEIPCEVHDVRLDWVVWG